MKYEDIKHKLKEGMKVSTGFYGAEYLIYKGNGYGDGYYKEDNYKSPVKNLYLKSCTDIEILTNPDGSPYSETRRFQVGDKVKVINNQKASNLRLGMTGTIVPHEYHGDYAIKWDNNGLIGWAYEVNLEKIKDEPKSMTLSEYRAGSSGVIQINDDDVTSSSTIYQSFNCLSCGQTIMGVAPIQHNCSAIIKEPKAQKETNKMSVIKSLKAKLSPVDRKLVKHGYLTSSGERTGMYEEELQEAAIAELIEAQDTTEFRKELAKALSDEE